MISSEQISRFYKNENKNDTKKLTNILNAQEQ